MCLILFFISNYCSSIIILIIFFTENASTPYGAVVIIGDMEYGYGYGSSKKQAKAEAGMEYFYFLL